MPLDIAISGYEEPSLIGRLVIYKKLMRIILPNKARKTKICIRETSRIMYLINTS